MGLSTGLYVHGKLLGLAVQRALVGTRCANSHIDCRNGIKILLSGSFYQKMPFGFQVGVCWPKKKMLTTATASSSCGLRFTYVLIVKMHLGIVLETGFWQIRRSSALKTCIY